MKLHELTIHEAHELLKQKKISSIDLTKAVFDQLNKEQKMRRKAFGQKSQNNKTLLDMIAVLMFIIAVISQHTQKHRLCLKLVVPVMTSTN